MNKHFFKTLAKAFALSCMSFAMVSCSDTDELIGEQGGGDAGNIPVVFSSAVAGGQSWTEGDKLSVLIDGSIREFTASAKGLLTPTEPLFWNGTESRDVEAWFPAADPRPSSVEISRDQSANLQPDFLYAKARVTPSERKKLEFNHQLAKIEVVFNTTKEVGAVTIGYEAFNLKASWDGGVWSNLSTPGEVQPKDMGNKTFAALVLPQSVAANTKFVHATVGTQRMYFSLKADQKLEAGNTYTFTLTPTDEGTTPDPQPVVPTLNSDKASIVADGVETVIFTVDPATATIVKETAGGTLSGNKFTTTEAKTYSFYAELDGQKSQKVTITATAKPEPEPAAPALSAASTSIEVNETTALMVMYDGVNRTADAQFSVSGGQVSNGAFSSAVAGVFTITAQVEGRESNTISITVNEPQQIVPVLTATPSTIKNNGQKTTFKVICDTMDVTAQAQIKNEAGEVLPTNEFSSTETGSFSFHATYNGVDSEPVVVTVEADEVIPDKDFDKLIIRADAYVGKKGYDSMTTGIPYTLNYGTLDVTKSVGVYYDGEATDVSKDSKLRYHSTGIVDIWAAYDGTLSNVVKINFTYAGTGAEPQQVEYPMMHADKSVISGDGVDFVKFDTYPVDAEVICKEKPEWMNGKKFTATKPGTYHFQVRNANGTHPGQLTITVQEGARLDLSATKLQIENDGIDKTLFTVRKGGGVVTSQATITKDGQAFYGREFKTLNIGTYKFQADLNGQKSNIVTITVVQAAAKTTLLANKTTIFANGTDAVTFTISPAHAVISCKELPAFSGKTFTTNKAGIYHFTATADGRQSKEIVIEAIEVPTTPMDGDVTVNKSENDGWNDQGSKDDSVIM